MPPGMHKFAHFLGNKIHTNLPLGTVLTILYLTFLRSEMAHGAFSDFCQWSILELMFFKVYAHQS